MLSGVNNIMICKVWQKNSDNGGNSLVDKDVLHMQLVYETRNVCILITPYKVYA